jgi:hypothetical protein
VRRLQDIFLLAGKKRRERLAKDLRNLLPVILRSVGALIAMKLALEDRQPVAFVYNQVDAAVHAPDRVLDESAVREFDVAQGFPCELLEGAANIVAHDDSALKIQVRDIGKAWAHISYTNAFAPHVTAARRKQAMVAIAFGRPCPDAASAAA